jgi:anti-sigma factor RsiW
MPFDPDNPIWTAYVLGELSDDERTEIEQTLEHSAEARQYVDELRQLSTLLVSGLASEPAVGLTEIQREAILAALSGSKPAQSPLSHSSQSG